MTDRFDTGEVDLAYSEWDGAGPPVVCLHGLSADKGTLPPLLPSGRRAFAYDARGHGELGRTPGAYTWVNYGRDAIEFLRGVVREPAILLGHSLGAITAIYAAANAPELVKGAFLLEPPIYSEDGVPGGTTDAFRGILAVAGKPVSEVTAAGHPPGRAEQISRLDGEAVEMSIDGRNHDGWDTDGLLGRTRCPVVLQHGDPELGGQPPERISRAAARIAGCSVLHIGGTGHFAWMPERERTMSEIAVFVQSVS